MNIAHIQGDCSAGMEGERRLQAQNTQPGILSKKSTCIPTSPVKKKTIYLTGQT